MKLKDISPLNNKIPVFVYGTLKRNGRLNFYLENATFKGMAFMKKGDSLEMFTLGGFPAVVDLSGAPYPVEDFRDAILDRWGGKYYYANIVGEVWMVDRQTLRTLDMVEGAYEKRKARVTVDTPDGFEKLKAFVYIMNWRSYGEPELRSFKEFTKREIVDLKEEQINYIIEDWVPHWADIHPMIKVPRHLFTSA